MGKMKVKQNKLREQILFQMEKVSDNCWVFPEAAEGSEQTVPAVPAVLQVLGKQLFHLSALLLQVGSVVPGQRAFPSPTANAGDVWDEEKVIVPQKRKCTAVSRNFQWNFRIHKEKAR